MGKPSISMSMASIAFCKRHNQRVGSYEPCQACCRKPWSSGPSEWPHCANRSKPRRAGEGRLENGHGHCKQHLLLWGDCGDIPVCWINRDKPSIFTHFQAKSGNSHISPAFFHVFWPPKRQLGQLGAGGRYKLLGGGHRSGLRLQCPGPVQETWWGILMNLGVHHFLRDRQYMYVYILCIMYIYIYMCVYVYIYICMYSIVYI